MNAQSTHITFDDSVPPTGAGDITLFDTAIACTGKRQINGAGGGMKRFLWNIVLDEAGVIRLDKSSDRGSNWVTVVSGIAVVTGVDGGLLIQHYDDFRIVFTNGGTDQTVWEVDLMLTGERSDAGLVGAA
jgi:hypothetical protein